MNTTKDVTQTAHDETHTERPLQFVSGDMTLLQAIENVLASDPDTALRELLWKIISTPQRKNP